MTVAFVTYKYFDHVRRVGPMPLEAAETFAAEAARKEHVHNVRLEEWASVKVREFHK